MATYVLIHGGGDTAFYWHLIAPALRERGHEVVAMDLPCDDESAGLWEYQTQLSKPSAIAPSSSSWPSLSGRSPHRSFAHGCRSS